MFSFEEYFRNPYKGRYALKVIYEDDTFTGFRLCDGSIINLNRSVDSERGWFIDDTRYPVTKKSRRYYKRYGNALSFIELLNARVIQKILASA